jgi:hypothetical protein
MIAWKPTIYIKIAMKISSRIAKYTSDCAKVIICKTYTTRLDIQITNLAACKEVQGVAVQPFGVVNHYNIKSNP